MNLGLPGADVGWRQNFTWRLAGLLPVLWLAGAACGQAPTTVWIAPTGPIVADTGAPLWLHVLNSSPQTLTWNFPARFDATLALDQRVLSVTLELSDTNRAPDAVIPPGGFARREYLLTVPASANGRVVLEVLSSGASKVLLEVQPPVTTAPGEAAPPNEASAKKSQGKLASDNVDPIDFFKRHLYPHEPFYFIAGPKSPNAKFQVSLKYQLFDPDAGLGQRFPVVSGLYLGYTQTSLWDWEHPSAPFLDTSYKPEIFYEHKGLVRTGTNGWFRLDVQGGYQHESNGRDGSASRSMNFVYLKPTLVFGRERSLQLTLAPRAWVYVFDLSDNPDIADYRGYADLVATLGWSRSLQLATTFRIGDTGRHPSFQFDLTYPLNRVPWCGLTWYLHAQYFTGYGEAFLNYKQSTDAFRLGFSLYR